MVLFTHIFELKILFVCCFPGTKFSCKNPPGYNTINSNYIYKEIFKENVSVSVQCCLVMQRIVNRDLVRFFFTLKWNANYFCMHSRAGPYVCKI